jgi:hypothetical protein
MHDPTKHTVTTTLQPDRTIDVSEAERRDLHRLGLLADTTTSPEGGESVSNRTPGSSGDKK